MAKANSNSKSSFENGLPVLGEDERFDISNSSSRRNAPLSSRSVSQSSRRTPTPTKQISLTAVKRREDSFYEDDPSQIEEVRTSMKLEAERSFVKETFVTEFVVERNTEGSQLAKVTKPSRHNCVHNGEVEIPVQRETKVREAPKKKVEEPNRTKPEEKKSLVTKKTEESSSSEDDSDDEEDRKAPNQLLMEFLECIYAKDYQNASKLCKMILIYEPNHEVALQFQPVIADKIQLDLEAEQEGSGESGSDDDSGEEDDEDEDDSDDSDDDSDESDNDSSAEDDNNEDENEENQMSDDSAVGETEDSGIASTESSDRDNYYEM